MEPVLALLHGVNVGGHRRLPMAELRQALGAAGFTEVRTYIQSGNVLFREWPAAAGDAATAVAAVVSARFGFDVEVVCRDRGEVVSVLERNPFVTDETDLAKLHVMFLNEPPDPDRVANLDVDRSPPDRFAVAARELYLHYPNGAARSKLTVDYVQRTLQCTATARNMKTVSKLLELLASM